MEIAANLAAVRRRMEAACRRARRSPESVRLMAVTKTVPPEAMRQAAACGLHLFGENRVQEAAAKREALADLPLEWHLIGGLQSNKANRAAALFDAVDSVDSLALAQRLDQAAGRLGKRLPVLLQVNIGSEPQKHGVGPGEAPELAAALLDLAHLRLSGLMAIPPASASAEDSRPWFAALRRLSERICADCAPAAGSWELSMGMSHDFEIAIEEGATLVRVGSALFGSRPLP